ncbi:MAG TPA: calcium-binding protein, partial [Nitrospiraceae bacterium]|nr:calcium-binding protein [Nitrospiraceae bacterium]
PWDFFLEPLNEGTDDMVISSISFPFPIRLPMGIEHIILVGAAIEATGNDLDNSLTGNSRANKLDGGVGADTMTGGTGADTYVVDDPGDQVVETTAGVAGGIDTVLSSINFELTTLINVEKLTLAMGFGDLDATGNGLNNTLLGNEGANVLDGLAGNDTMTGGKGDDTYVVDSLTDVVNETILNSNGGGVDLVSSSVNLSLATRTNIENLTLTGGAVSGTGNALNNAIVGNAANNVLNGGTGNDTLTGGEGSDKLTGGTGRDTFDFDLKSELGDADSITDFTKGAGGDVLDISDLLESVSYAGSDVFADGYLSFGYSNGTTSIMFDDDGVGANNALLLVSLTNVTLTASNTENFAFNYTV